MAPGLRRLCKLHPFRILCVKDGQGIWWSLPDIFLTHVQLSKNENLSGALWQRGMHSETIDLNIRSFCAFSLTFEKLNVVTICTTVSEFRNGNIYFFFSDTDEREQRYELTHW